MGNTALGLFGVSLAAALAELLLPSEEGKGTRVALRLLVSLAVLLLILRPFLGFFHQSPELYFESLVGEGEEDLTERYEKIFENAVKTGSAQELKRGVHAWLLAEYGIKEEEAHVKVHLDDAGALLRVEIYLSGSALLQDPRVPEAALRAKLGCETEVR